MGAVSTIIAASFDKNISGIIHSFIFINSNIHLFLIFLGIIVDSAFSNMK
jgi:hypothetical protein